MKKGGKQVEENMSVTAEEAVVVAESAAVFEEAVPQKKKRKPINQQKLQDNLWGWLFCVPLIVGTILFVYVAFILALLLSFTEYNTMTANGGVWEYLGRMFGGESAVFDMTKFGGGEHDPFYWYKFAFTNPGWEPSQWATEHGIPGTIEIMPGVFEETTIARTMNAMGATLFNTVFYMLGIPIGMVLAIFFAVCMSRDIKGGNVFRVLYYIPCVASTISIIYTFKIIFKTDGVINQILGTDGLNWMRQYGVSEYAWSPDIDTYWSQGMLSKFMVVIMSVWKGLGGTVILYVAGLSGVNAATKEAAQIDGANGWTIFWKVTMPDLYPVIFYNIVTSVIGGLQIYAEPELLFDSSGGRPSLMTSGFVSLIWYYGMNGADSYGARASQGAAYGMILAVIIFVITLFQFWLDGRKNKA